MKIGETKQAHEIVYTGYAKYIWHACEQCGVPRWGQIVKGQPVHKVCRRCNGILHERENGINWKGGKTISGGYAKILLPPNDPFYSMANSQGYVLEHRLVMAKCLSRCLLPWEVVHHKNSIRTDNRLENLQLLPAAHYHTPDNQLKQYSRRLERIIQKQYEQIKLLLFSIQLRREE